MYRDRAIQRSRDLNRAIRIARLNLGAIGPRCECEPTFGCDSVALPAIRARSNSTADADAAIQQRDSVARFNRGPPSRISRDPGFTTKVRTRYYQHLMSRSKKHDNMTTEKADRELEWTPIHHKHKDGVTDLVAPTRAI